MSVPQVNHAAVRRAMAVAAVPHQQEIAAQIEIRNTAHVAAGGRICGSLTRTGDRCTHPAVAVFLTGPRCGHHTPAAVAGRPEPAPDPARTMDGLRRAWYADRGLPFVEFHTPAGETVVDQRAVASGKRRSSHHVFRAAQAAVNRGDQ